MIQCTDFQVGHQQPLCIIAGPCVVEDAGLTFDIAARLQEITADMPVNFIFKASVDKANRSSINSFRGLGYDAGLATLADIKKKLSLPVLTDIHTPETVAEVAAVVDVLQIPAFLCRQTDLLVRAAETGLPVNIKKGQFLAPWDMQHVLAKAKSTGNEHIMLTERGSMFGYNNLVVDMRSLSIMAGLNAPVIFDMTHSVQLPGGGGATSSGQREFIPTLARAAVAAGVDGLFLETHPDPSKALSDGPNSIPLHLVADQLKKLVELHVVVQDRADYALES